MRTTAISERYVGALYEVAEKNDEVERVHNEAGKLLGIFGANPRFMDLLRSPQIPDTDRKKFVRSALRSASPLMLRMVLLLVDKHRVENLPQILTLFQKEYNRRRGVLSARLLTARALDPEVTRPLQDRLEKRLRRKVALQVIVDESIIAGFIFMSETLLIDASIRHQLELLRAHMSSYH